MSEYQYYEFRTDGRLLTASQMRRLRAYSTRAAITPTRFQNVYHWGDFKGDPKGWVEKYFDGYVHFANWGTREFALRLPSGAISVKVCESPDERWPLSTWSDCELPF